MTNRRWRLVLGAALIFGVLMTVPLMLSACGPGIPVKQEVLFTNHKTILPSDFPRHGYALEQLELKGHDGAALRAWWMTSPEATGTVVYFGGQGFHMVQSRAWLDAVLPHASTNVLMVDYRGYGLSEGEPGVEDLQKDALAVFDAVVQRARVEPGRVVVHGQSMGSFVALHVA
ncbi:MAG: alpha/beta fold hydrolase, partial [Myxococcota bacterium]